MNEKNKFEEWQERYHNEEFIDIKNNLTNNDLKLLKKLGIIVKDKIYTEYEYDVLTLDLIKYYKDDRMDKEDLEIVAPL